ncbi:hypothetical protein [Faucicola boevrei]|uniref:hypothetical protein n=1 Tax=Faucicola boevrei TaxID=346665 RepID=UPI0003756A4F|nr:hypothetical protein [Moraxella boevrei]
MTTLKNRLVMIFAVSFMLAGGWYFETVNSTQQITLNDAQATAVIYAKNQPYLAINANDLDMIYLINCQKDPTIYKVCLNKPIYATNIVLYDSKDSHEKGTFANLQKAVFINKNQSVIQYVNNAYQQNIIFSKTIRCIFTLFILSIILLIFQMFLFKKLAKDDFNHKLKNWYLFTLFGLFLLIFWQFFMNIIF